MTLIYFSTDLPEIQHVSKELTALGVVNQVRPSPTTKSFCPGPSEFEVWIQEDHDCNRAFLFCVRSRAGFAKRRPEAFESEPWQELAEA